VSKVKIDEITSFIARLPQTKAMMNLYVRLVSYGIEVAYTPMSENELFDIYTQWQDGQTVSPQTYKTLIAFAERNFQARLGAVRLGAVLTLDQARAICEANGFAVVPVEPTNIMVEAGRKYYEENIPFAFYDSRYAGVYKAMLEASKEVK
jgi:hypothetical protein